MRLIVRVNPNSHKDEVIFEEKDLFGNLIMRIKTTKPAENGKANKAVIEILAKYFQVSKSDIEVISGHSSRTKLVNVNTK